MNYFKLPDDVKTLIYTFDGTYKEKYDDVVKEINLRTVNKHKIIISKQLIQYYKVYIQRYKNITVFNRSIWESENLYYKKLYDINIYHISIFNIKDTDYNIQLDIWVRMFEETRNHWNRCYNSNRYNYPWEHILNLNYETEEDEEPQEEEITNGEPQEEDIFYDSEEDEPQEENENRFISNSALRRDFFGI